MSRARTSGIGQPCRLNRGRTIRGEGVDERPAVCPLRHRSAPNQRTLRHVRLVAGAPAAVRAPGPVGRRDRRRSGPGGTRASRTGRRRPRRHRCRHRARGRPRSRPHQRRSHPRQPRHRRSPVHPPASRWGPRPGSRRRPSGRDWPRSGPRPGRRRRRGGRRDRADRRCFLRAPRQRLRAGPPRPLGCPGRAHRRLGRGRARPRLRAPGLRRLPHPGAVPRGGHDHERGRHPRGPAHARPVRRRVPRHRVGRGEGRPQRLDERGVRLGHARVLRPRGRAGPRARHRAHAGAPGHAGPRAHPRAPGPALRPDPDLRRHERPAARQLRHPAAGRGGGRRDPDRGALRRGRADAEGAPGVRRTIRSTRARPPPRSSRRSRCRPASSVPSRRRTGSARASCRCSSRSAVRRRSTRRSRSRRPARSRCSTR